MGKFLDIHGLNYFYQILKSKVSISESDVDYVFDNPETTDEELENKVISIKSLRYYSNKIKNYINSTINDNIEMIDERIDNKIDEKLKWNQNIPQ